MFANVLMKFCGETFGGCFYICYRRTCNNLWTLSYLKGGPGKLLMYVFIILAKIKLPVKSFYGGKNQDHSNSFY